MKTFVSALGASLALASSPLTFSQALEQRVEEVVVTATRTPVSVADSLSSVTVISAEELSAMQAFDLVDVFRQVPGIDIGRSGGPGSTASLFMRGTGNGQTLILVDGQRINSATLGSTNFQFLDPKQIERIEVVRGAASSLYGSDAIGGVIQIFTKEGKTAPDHTVSVAAGSHHLWEGALGSSGSSGNFRYSANLSKQDTSGIDNLVDDRGYNVDKDGYRNTSLNASLGYRFSDGTDLSFRALQSDSRNEYDNASNTKQQPYSDTRLRNLNAKLALPVSDWWLSQLSVGSSQDASENYDAVNSASLGDFRTDRDQLLWQNDFAVAEAQVLTLGYDHYKDGVGGSSAYQDASGNRVSSRNNSALFAQHQASFEQLKLLFGLRQDDNEEFGEHSSANVALGYTFNKNHQLTFSWSEGFRAPTFNDLYWPAGPFSAGNPALSPESSENYEAGLRGDYDAWNWTATYYQNDVADLINWAPGADGIWRPYNVNNAEIDGAELTVGTVIAGWRAEGSLSYNNPRDAASGNVLVNRSQRSASLNLDKDLLKWSLGLSFQAQSERFTNASNSQALDGYGTVAARISFRYNSRLTAQIKIDNMLDNDYQLNKGYNTMGANWRLNLMYTL